MRFTGNREAGLVCPHCSSRDTVCLETVSARANADYFRCMDCNLIWALKRGVVEPPCDYPKAV